jgi:hypothetical protein
MIFEFLAFNLFFLIRSECDININGPLMAETTIFMNKRFASTILHSENFNYLTDKNTCTPGPSFQGTSCFLDKIY